jgi:hypothetical protein
VGKVELPLHVELLGDQGVEVFADFVVRDDELIQLPFNPHKKDLSREIDMLIKIGDVAVVGVNKLTNGRDYSLVIGTMDQQDGGRRQGIESYGFHIDG